MAANRDFSRRPEFIRAQERGLKGAMKKKTIGIVLAAALSLGALAAVGAEVAGHHRRGGRMGMHGMFMGKEMESRLNLTAEQKQKVEAMHQRQREQMKSQMAAGPED